MIELKYRDKLYERYKNNNVVLERIDKLNSMEIFNNKNVEDDGIMVEKYFWLFDRIFSSALKRYEDKTELFYIVNNVFYDSIEDYLIDDEKFQQLYNSCEEIQKILIKELKFYEMAKRKRTIEDIFN